jgi:hypothetical protein
VLPAKYNNSIPPAAFNMFSKPPANRFSTSNTKIAIGPSLITGAKAAGNVLLHPLIDTRDSKKAISGPGCTAAANAKPLPIIMYLSISLYSFLQFWISFYLDGCSTDTHHEHAILFTQDLIVYIYPDNGIRTKVVSL